MISLCQRKLRVTKYTLAKVYAQTNLLTKDIYIYIYYIFSKLLYNFYILYTIIITIRI